MVWQSRSAGVVAMVLAAVAVGAPPARAQETPAVVVDDTVDIDGADFILVPFDVPAGTAEIEVRHESLGDSDILDFGVDDPDGFRGWGGGNTEAAVVGEFAASRSYLPGPLPAGTWNVVVGRAKVVSADPRYHIEVFIRQTPTLVPATDRAPYAATTLSTDARFYAGDLHVHSEDSGDARPPLVEIAEFAGAKGLDFVVVTDHNTTSHVDRLTPAQAGIDDVLLVPGMEFTTYGGHMNAFGVTRPIDQKLGLSTTIDQAAAAIAAQGGLSSINHPTLDLGDVCIGCAWVHEVPETLSSVEVATGGYDQSGFIFGQSARDFWDTLLDDGRHVAPVGGSDDHTAGVDVGAFGSPIGDPTTLIFATSLSTEALLQGIRDNRTVVKLQGPDDPMIDLQTFPERTAVDDGPADRVTGVVGDTVVLDAHVTGGAGTTLQWLRAGKPLGDAIAIASDDETITLDVVIDDDVTGGADDRYRAEVLVDGITRTVTGHVWVSPPAPITPLQSDCGSCHTSGPDGGAFIVVALLWRRRRRHAHRDRTGVRTL